MTIPAQRFQVMWARRAMVLAGLLLVTGAASSGQTSSVLHIKVALVDSDGTVTAVPRHALLVGDNPPTAVPRRVVTKIDGTVDVNLRPGTYTIESDAPLAFRGKSYEWTQQVEIVAGRDSVLELTAANADVVARATSATSDSAAPADNDPAFLLPEWQDSVVALWTEKTRGSGFLFDAKGLVATNQRIVGPATSVEVQLTATLKVTGRVLASDALRDVAVVSIDPQIARSIKPVPLGCAAAPKPATAQGQVVLTIGAPLREQKRLISGVASRVERQAIASTLALDASGVGGPAFAATGAVIGLTSPVDEKDSGGRDDIRVIPIAAVCDVVESAHKKMTAAARPADTPLPVEPLRPFPMQEAVADAERRGAGASATSYEMSSSEFDIIFITPLLKYSTQRRSGQTSSRDPLNPSSAADRTREAVRRITDFANWSEYVADDPPVLLIRVTPRFEEGLWTTIGRVAARTQGVALPPIKRFKSGFSRLRAMCGDAEVTPIHPFRLELRMSENDAIHEGLYVFDPGALGPQCRSARLILYSEKEPGRGETRDIDPKVLQTIWQDFAAFRAVTQ
jgi:S1-C subfamily serine protease